MSVQICLPGFDKEVYEAALRQDRADLPVCGKMPVVPVWGNVVATKGTVNDGPARKEVEAWDFQLQETKCRLGVREAPQILSCLEGSWLVLLGASQSSVWLQQLANTLAPNAFNALRDHFITDGVWLQLMDLVIEDGQVVHKQIVYNGDMTQLNNHGGAHSAELDAVALPGVYANLALAPPFNGRQIRITNLLAEYWDEADLGLLALEGSTEGGWDRAQIFPVVAVGLWYGYSVGCTLGWCSTRPEIAGLDTEAMVEVYLQGMRRTADMLQDFCGPNGRASKHGCTVMSVEYCSEYYKNPVYNHLHQAIRKHFQEYTSSQVRYFDVYSLTEQVPEDCIYGHMSPASAAFVLQLLLSSVCPTDQVAEGSLVTFKGKACRSEQIQPMCPGMSCGNFTYTWDYALSKNCQLLAAKDENQKSPLPQGGATADAWMLQVDDIALTTTTTTTTLFEANVSNSTESNISNATTTRQAVVVVADVQPDEEKEYKIFGTTTAPKGAQGFETSVMKDNVFLAWYNMLSAQKETPTSANGSWCCSTCSPSCSSFGTPLGSSRRCDWTIFWTGSFPASR
ncbi:unnamed protein product [Effrenium voratum]|uniref:Uncharacterized protein n=1 Tax=Effrenium voratum TaxID=2562239 RepID=A0AA36HS96_9DINO|nr:unnamed protein product [Effrenium voratum]